MRAGECRFHGSWGRQATERRGRHPRDARRPGHQDLTQELRMGTEDTREETGLEPLMDIEEMDIQRGETPSPSDVPAELPLPPAPEETES